MTPLPKPCVDTGMGLERLAAVLQHVHSNYEIDLFVSADRRRGARDADAPTSTIAVAAGDRRPHPRLRVPDRRRRDPGNEGRGYVLRRIIRRAIRHGYKLGQKRPFFHELVADLDRQMGDAYPGADARQGARRARC